MDHDSFALLAKVRLKRCIFTGAWRIADCTAVTHPAKNEAWAGRLESAIPYTM